MVAVAVDSVRLRDVVGGLRVVVQVQVPEAGPAKTLGCGPTLWRNAVTHTADRHQACVGPTV